MATERIVDLQRKLEAAQAFLQDATTRRESDKQQLQREAEESEKFYDRHYKWAKATMENLENQIKSDRENWKNWSDAELIRRWETGDFNYEHLKYVDNAKRLRHAYSSSSSDLAPPSVSRIMRVSAQVGAGWYNTPKDVPYCNPPHEKREEKRREIAPPEPNKGFALDDDISGSVKVEHSEKSLPKPVTKLTRKSARKSATKPTRKPTRKSARQSARKLATKRTPKSARKFQGPATCKAPRKPAVPRAASTALQSNSHRSSSPRQRSRSTTRNPHITRANYARMKQEDLDIEKMESMAQLKVGCNVQSTPLTDFERRRQANIATNKIAMDNLELEGQGSMLTSSRLASAMNNGKTVLGKRKSNPRSLTNTTKRVLRTRTSLRTMATSTATESDRPPPAQDSSPVPEQQLSSKDTNDESDESDESDLSSLNSLSELSELSDVSDMDDVDSSTKMHAFE